MLLGDFSPLQAWASPKASGRKYYIDLRLKRERERER